MPWADPRQSAVNVVKLLVGNTEILKILTFSQCFKRKTLMYTLKHITRKMQLRLQLRNKEDVVKGVGNKGRKQRNDFVEKATSDNFSAQYACNIIKIFILNDFTFRESLRSHVFIMSHEKICKSSAECRPLSLISS